jgi:hypothetical protein
MSHWFDDVAKGLALGTLSRRDALKLTFQAGLAATGFRVLGDTNTLAQLPAKAQGPPKPTRTIPAGVFPVGGCVRRTAGNSITQEVSVDQGGITFHRQQLYDQANQVARDSTTISRGQTLILKIDVSAARGGAATATIKYGAEVKGVQNVIMTSRDGKTFQGSMDGRAFTTSKTLRSMSEIRFTDGRPIPQISADPKLTPLISGLAKESQKEFASCRAAASVPPRRRLLV